MVIIIDARKLVCLFSRGLSSLLPQREDDLVVVADWAGDLKVLALDPVTTHVTICCSGSWLTNRCWGQSPARVTSLSPPTPPHKKKSVRLLQLRPSSNIRDSWKTFDHRHRKSPTAFTHKEITNNLHRWVSNFFFSSSSRLNDAAAVVNPMDDNFDTHVSHAQQGSNTWDEDWPLWPGWLRGPRISEFMIARRPGLWEFNTGI